MYMPPSLGVSIQALSSECVIYNDSKFTLARPVQTLHERFQDTIFSETPSLQVPTILPSRLYDEDTFYYACGPYRLHHSIFWNSMVYLKSDYHYFLQPVFHQIYTQVPIPRFLLSPTRFPITVLDLDIVYKFTRADVVEPFMYGTSKVQLSQYQSPLV